MILVRAPLRISFIGGGTDIPDFYRTSKGSVISTTIKQYVYLAIKHSKYVNKIIVKYSTTEIVDHPKHLLHNRVRESLHLLGIENSIEIGSFASIPARTGLGSSSSFTVALIRGLHHYKGINISNDQIAHKACVIEIEKLKEPIGKQDQYASAFGGFNIITFHPNEDVDVEPVKIPKENLKLFEDSILLFFTGMTRDASSVLAKQKLNISARVKLYKKMISFIKPFNQALIKGDIKRAGQILHATWIVKKKFEKDISNKVIDDLYSVGIKSGAWGGKILGAGGGGCLLFIAPQKKKNLIRENISKFSKNYKLTGFAEIPVEFENRGVEIVFEE